MTGRAAIATIPRHSAPAIGDGRVIPFPRRPRRYGDGRVTRAAAAARVGLPSGSTVSSGKSGNFTAKAKCQRKRPVCSMTR
jgi:hypothetical protein